MILQGTTPTLTISFDKNEIQLSTIAEVELLFRSGSTDTRKDQTDVTINTDANTVSYSFTEAETLAMDANEPLFWQIRLKTSNGVIVGTEKQHIFVADLMSEVVM